MQAKNERTITRAFARLNQASQHDWLEKSDAGGSNLLDFHEMGPPHGGHLESGGNYGWMMSTRAVIRVQPGPSVQQQNILPKLRNGLYGRNAFHLFRTLKAVWCTSEVIQNLTILQEDMNVFDITAIEEEVLVRNLGFPRRSMTADQRTCTSLVCETMTALWSYFDDLFED